MLGPRDGAARDFRLFEPIKPQRYFKATTPKQSAGISSKDKDTK